MNFNPFRKKKPVAKKPPVLGSSDSGHTDSSFWQTMWMTNLLSSSSSDTPADPGKPADGGTQSPDCSGHSHSCSSHHSCSSSSCSSSSCGSSGGSD
jgi:hypothetical protein